MANSASPPSFSTSHAAVPSSTSFLPSDLSPASLDTIPILASILARVQTNSTSTTLSTGASPLTQTQTQSQPHTQTQSSPGAKDIFSTAPLTAKEIPAATDELKHRLQRAREQIAQLPDISCGINDQEDEIRELQAKIAKQRETLQKLQSIGMAAGKATQGMKDSDKMET